MKLFDLPQAQHYASTAGKPGPGLVQSLPSFHGQPRCPARLVEGDQYFNAHQASVLTSVERWIMFSIIHYRRAFDMLIPAAAPWAQVTLYYSSFFAANAILGTFGGWIGHVNHGGQSRGTRVVEVEDGTPTSQILRREHNARSPHRENGSHLFFWDIFYDSVQPLKAWAPPQLMHGLDPVNNDYGWQIKARNQVNYDTFKAWAASEHFHGSFNARKFRQSLAGPLAQQVETTETLIRLASTFAKDVALDVASLEGCGGTGKRLVAQRALVTATTPSVTDRGVYRDMLG